MSYFEHEKDTGFIVNLFIRKFHTDDVNLLKSFIDA